MSSEATVEQTDKIEISKEEYETLVAKSKELSKVKEDVTNLMAFKDQLLKEKRESEEKRKAVKEEAARKAGDFEQLLKSSEEQRKELENKLGRMHESTAKERITAEAMRIASSEGMAEGSNVELLSEFIGRRLKYTDEGIKILDKNGQLTVSTVDDLKHEISSDTKYASLLTKTKASGGGATGSSKSAAKTVMTKEEYAALPPMKQAAFNIAISKGEADIN